MDYRDYRHLTFERRDRGVCSSPSIVPRCWTATNDRLLVVSHFSELNSV